MQNNVASLRLLRAGDEPDLMRLSAAAGWNQIEADWQRLIELEPEGCFGAECDGVLASSTTAIRYPAGPAWIGMVLTLPEFRGRGLARMLLNHALDWLDSKGIPSKLDATDMGRPVYERAGYEPEYFVERWCRDPGPIGDAPVVLGSWNGPAEWRDLDFEATGTDRAALLGRLAVTGAATIPGEGFALWRPGRVAWQFGPCVVRSAGAARQLLLACLAECADRVVFWDLCPDLADVCRLASEFGFKPARRLLRMRRGNCDLRLAQPSPLVCALASFEYG